MVPPDHRGALDELTGLLCACSEGEGGLVLVSGGPGSGKTELLQRFAARVVDSGALLLSAAGSWSEQSLPAGVLDQLFHGAGLRPETADRLARVVTDYTLVCESAAADPRGTSPAYPRLVQELCAVLLELSRDRPLVVSVDDVPLADPVSQQFLLDLRRRAASARVLIVLSEWDTPHPPSLRFHAEVTRRPHRRIRLEPLTESDIVAVLSEHVDRRIATRMAPTWHRVSGGNVMLVSALVDDLVNGELVDEERAGPVFAATIAAGLHRGAPALADVAKAIAVLRDDCTEELAARVSGHTRHVTGRMIDTLEAVGLVRGARFRHPRAAEAVLATLSSEERSRSHTRAAQLLHRYGAPATVVADHLLSVERLDGEWAVPVLRVAAEQALGADDAGRAVRYLETALDIALDCQRFEVNRMLVRALWRSNPLASAAQLAPLREAMREGRLRGRDLVLLVWHDLWCGDSDAALRALDVCRDDPTSLDAQSAAELRIICRFHGVRAEFVGTVRASSSEDDPWVEAALAVGRFWTTNCGSEAVAAAEHILQSSGVGETAPEVVGTALLVLTYAGRGEDAARWCAGLSREARTRGVRTWEAFLGVIDAHLALRRGEFDAAIQLAVRAYELLPPQAWGVAIGYPLAVRLLANLSMGRYADADELLRHRVPDAMFGNVIGLFYLHARGNVQLARGRTLAAISDFQHCGTRMRQWGPDLPQVAPWRLGLAEANLALGRRDVVRELLTEQLDRPGVDRFVRAETLRLLAEVSDPEERPMLLRQCETHLRSAGEAHVLLLLTAGDGDDTAAVPASDSAAEPDDADPASWAAVPLTWRATDPDEPPSLSDSELRVAELAAAGHTNREISRLLYVTVSTVEQHLTRVYRKLKVKGRAELPERLRVVPVPDTPIGEDRDHGGCPAIGSLGGCRANTMVSLGENGRSAVPATGAHGRAGRRSGTPIRDIGVE